MGTAVRSLCVLPNPSVPELSGSLWEHSVFPNPTSSTVGPKQLPLPGLHILFGARSSTEEVNAAMAHQAVAEGVFGYPGLPIQNFPKTSSKIRLQFLFRKRRL